MDKSRIFTVRFSKVYPFYVQKAEKKGHTKEDVDVIIRWLTGYSQQALQQQIDRNVDFETFFAQAPQINPDASKITGKICGCRVEEIEDKLMQKIRCLDKLIDELAKGKPVEKILGKYEEADMWKCEKCGREFKNTGQKHYCSKFTAIDEYISAQNPEVQPVLHEVRRIIRENAPDATEKISWGMPTFWQGKNLIHFAAFKKHLGIFPGDLTPSPFIDKLDKYRHTKGAIQFPYNKAIDYDFIAEIVRYKVKNV